MVQSEGFTSQNPKVALDAFWFTSFKTPSGRAFSVFSSFLFILEKKLEYFTTLLPGIYWYLPYEMSITLWLMEKWRKYRAQVSCRQFYLTDLLSFDKIGYFVDANIFVEEEK